MVVGLQVEVCQREAIWYREDMEKEIFLKEKLRVEFY